MDEVVCLYHADCFDGLGAAWAVSRRHPDGVFLPVDYRDPIPEGLEGKHVVIVDFSYKLPTMLDIIAIAKRVTLIDHHEGSKSLVEELNALNLVNVYAEYDEHRSGAVMAWDHFWPDAKRPRILEHIEDRDLNRNALPGTKAIMLGMGIYPLELKVWHRVLDSVDHHDPIQENSLLFHLQTNGDVINIKNQTDIDRIIKQTLRYVDFLDHVNVPLINIPRALASDALLQLAETHPFALGYYDDETHRVFSMRSCKKTGVKVRPLAEAMGGGGHAHAAAFTVSRDHELARI